MSIGSAGPARNRDEVYIEYPNIIRIKYYKEFMTLKNQLKRMGFLFLFLIPMIPLPILKGEQFTLYQSLFLYIEVPWMVLVIIFALFYAFSYNRLDELVFDMNSQTIIQAKLRVIPFFGREFVENTFPFSNVKSIETNKEEYELTAGKPFHRLNLQISIYNSDATILLLHLPHSGKLQGLTYDIWIKLFQKVIESQTGTTTEDITQDYSIETVKMSYIKDHYTFHYN